MNTLLKWHYIGNYVQRICLKTVILSG